AVAAAFVLEHWAAVSDLLRPQGLPLAVQAAEELVGRALRNPPLGDAGQHHAVGRHIGAVRVGRIGVDPLIAGAGVILAEIEERRTAKAGAEFPVGPFPALAVVLRPGELRVAGVARPQVQHAAHAEDAAGLLRPGAVADLLAGRGADVLAFEIRRVALHPGETPAPSFGHKRLENPTSPHGGVPPGGLGPKTQAHLRPPAPPRAR